MTLTPNSTPPTIQLPPDAPAGFVWHDVTTWGVEGRGWPERPRQRWFDRLPAEAKGRVIDPVWELSRDSAGQRVGFRTDAPAIWAAYSLRREKLTEPYMTAIGSSGLDLYGRDEAGQWRWAGVVRRPESRTICQGIVEGIAPGFREYALYLPLCNGVENLSIGVPSGVKFEPVTPRTEAPLVFYGTSITHGICASRPGMTHVAILGRRLEHPVINLGFSGHGLMEAAIGELLARLPAAAFIIDCLPNMDAALVRERCGPLVKQLRAAHPETPILLVEDRRNANAWLLPQRNQHHSDNHAALRDCFQALQAEKIPGLHYVPGDSLFGHDAEGSTDGSHPNDLGFVRQADVFEPILRAALRRDNLN